jgi:hypothetical protein
LSVVQELWDNARALNVVVLVQLDTVFHMYTWFPYQSRQQYEDATDVVLINQWGLQGEGKLVNDELLYPNKIPSDLQGCPFKRAVKVYKFAKFYTHCCSLTHTSIDK